MKPHATSASDKTMVELETAHECGFWLWLSKRVGNRPIRIQFDTTDYGDRNNVPTVWIEEIEEK